MYEKKSSSYHITVVGDHNFFPCFQARAARNVPGGWRFPPAAIFSGLDELLVRAHQLSSLVRTCELFGRLETLELGGPKGSELAASLQSIQAEFTEAVATTQEVRILFTLDVQDI